MDLYIINGPLHILESLCLLTEENRERQSFIVVIESFYGARDIFEKIKDGEIVSDGWLVQESELNNYIPKSNMSFRYRSKTIKGRLEIFNELYKNTPIFGIRFDRIYVAGTGNIPAFKYFIQYSKQLNNSKVFLIDDGLGSRLVEMKKANWISSLKSYFRGHRNDDIRLIADGKLFFSPELTIDAYPHTPRIRQTKPSKSSKERDELIEKIKTVFADESGQLEKDINRLSQLNCLFLSSGLDVCGYLSYFEKEKELIEKCSKKITAFEVKHHPASKQISESVISCFTSKFPLEILFLYTDIEKKLLISPISAALFNPKFIMDEEPYVALVYKLVGFNNIANEMFYCSDEEFTQRINMSLIEAYRDKEKVCIPETEKELFDFIDTYIRKELLSV